MDEFDMSLNSTVEGYNKYYRTETVSHKQKTPRNCRKRNSTFNYFFNI